MKPLCIAVLVLTSIAAASPHGYAAPNAAHHTKPAAKAPAPGQSTPKQRAALDVVLTQLAGLDTAAHAPITKDEYQTKVNVVYHSTLIPMGDLSPKSDAAAHAKNAFQAYRDALTAWDEPVPYSEWDNIQDSAYVTPGIVKKYHIPADFLEAKKDLDVYDLEDYAHAFINNAIWKYAHEEYLKAKSGKP